MDEAELVRCATTGAPLDVTEHDPDDRHIDAALVVDLCLGRRGDLHPKGLQLTGATVDGPLDLAHATVAAPLRLDGCRIEGDVDLTETSIPSVVVRQCTIAGGLGASGARTRSLVLDGAELTGPVVLRTIVVDGNLALTGAILGGIDGDGYSLDMRGARVSNSVLLQKGFRCAGAVRAASATINGDLVFWGAAIGGVDGSGTSFRGVQLHVGGSIFAGGALVCAGAVRLSPAHVDGDLGLVAARIEGADSDGTALHAVGIHVGGSVRLNDLSATGAVRLSDGVIGGSLTVRGARIAGPVDRYGNSFAADGLHVGRSVHLSGGFRAEGEVRLVGASIDGQLSFEDAAPVRVLALRGARCAELADTAASWPPAGGLELRGFRFDTLKLDAGWARRLDWIRRQGFERWSPEPYEQLAGYYSVTGDEDAARRIRVARGNDELTHLRTTRGWRSLGYRAWRRPLGWLVGYGYRRQRAAWLLVATLVLAGALFGRAEHEGAMVPDQPPAPSGVTPPCGDAYPCFNSWVYGADVVLPIIDFGQDTSWRPVETDETGPRWVWARWMFIAVGWALASVFVAAFTGLVQRG
jgi:hypothetical protein